MHSDQQLEASTKWTVEVELLGRRDGEPVAGIGTITQKGSYGSYTAAREACAAWERNETFIFKARAHHRGDR